MTFPQFTLDDVLKIVQITFYIFGVIIAILTYSKCKKSCLLNTVNTEYKKRVMDRLKNYQTSCGVNLTQAYRIIGLTQM